jgi:hypothetical protein
VTVFEINGKKRMSREEFIFFSKRNIGLQINDKYEKDIKKQVPSAC